MDESPAQRQRVGAVLLAVMVLGAAGLAWPRRHRDEAPAGVVAARPAGPASAGAMVPREARGVLRLDVAAMRRSPAFARWFDAVRSGDDPCAAAVGERVTGLVVVWSTTALDDFTVLADGPVDEPTFRRCAGGARAVEARAEADEPGAQQVDQQELIAVRDLRAHGHRGAHRHGG